MSIVSTKTYYTPFFCLVIKIIGVLIPYILRIVIWLHAYMRHFDVFNPSINTMIMEMKSTTREIPMSVVD